VKEDCQMQGWSTWAKVHPFLFHCLQPAPGGVKNIPHEAWQHC